MADIYRAVSKVVLGHVRREQPWDQTTPAIMTDIYRAVSKVVFGPRTTWTTMTSCKPHLFMADIYRAVSKVVSRPRPTWTTMTSCKPHLFMAVIYRAVSKVVSRPRPTWTTMRSGNPIYDLLYEFRLHCHLLGNLSIESPHNFDNNCFRSRETLGLNMKLYQ